MRSKKVTIKARDEKEFSGYLALPDAGKGPGLLLIQEIFGVNDHIKWVADMYAEQGYVVLAPDLFHRLAPDLSLGYEGKDREEALEYYRRFDEEQGLSDLCDAAEYLCSRQEQTGGVAALGFCLGGKLAFRLAARTTLSAVVSYYGGGLVNHLNEASETRCPMLFHLAENDQSIPHDAVEKILTVMTSRPGCRVYIYDNASHGFNCDMRSSYHQRSALLSQERTARFLTERIGPRINIEEAWENHLYAVYCGRNVDLILETMTADAVVTIIPTLTGGQGHPELRKFYEDMIVAHSGDGELHNLSRTVGTNSIVDELLLNITHDRPIEFLLPGVKPTNSYIQIPICFSVSFRGDKLARARAYFDLASLMKQTGLTEADLAVWGREETKKLENDSFKIDSKVAP